MDCVYVLHGVADRDEDELVCMFFSVLSDLNEFKEALPGRYQTLMLTGIAFDDFDIHIQRG